MVAPHHWFRTAVRALLVLFALSFVSTAQAAEDEKGFVPLFSGRDLSGWRVREDQPHPNRWKVQPDGVLKNEWTKELRSRDLVSERRFWNFTVRFDFMVAEGENSGVYLRGRHEIQLAGDFDAKKVSATSTGSIWNVTSPSMYALKPSGEWQTVSITIVGQEITVVLNDKTVQDHVTCTTATRGALDENVNAPGPLVLQGANGEVKFRNLRIKELPR